MIRTRVMLMAVLATTAFAAHGHGGHGGAHAIGTPRDPGETSFGRPGDAKSISRTLRVEIEDARCRGPAEVGLQRGDTVQFVIRNTGTRMHELVLGTSHELGQHAEQSEKDPDLDHDEPYIVHVEGGATTEMVWHFNRIGVFSYGCLIHGKEGPLMGGRINVFR